MADLEWPYGAIMEPEAVPREFAYLLEKMYRKGFQQEAHLAHHAADHRCAEEFQQATSDWRYLGWTWATRAMPLQPPRWVEGRVTWERTSYWTPGGPGLPATGRKSKEARMNWLVRASDLPEREPFNVDPEVNVFFGQRGINLRVYLRPTEDPRFKPQQEVAAALERLTVALASAGKTFDLAMTSASTARWPGCARR